MCLPDDGKEKKPSYSSPFDTPIRPAAALSTQGRRFYLSVQNRRPKEGAAMLIRPAFQRNKFLKSLCPAGDSSGQEYVLYHARKLHCTFTFAQWVYDLPGEFCRFLRPFGAGRSCRSNVDTGGNATSPGFSLSRRSGVRR